MASPQKENGYTAVANEILERLVNTGLLGTEYRILLFIIRKTYGFHKKHDVISLSQFQNCTGLSRPTVVKTIKNLVSRNIVIKTILSNIQIDYCLNKDYDTWVVNTPLLVKNNTFASKPVLTRGSKPVLTRGSKHGLTRGSKHGLTHKRNVKERKEISERSSHELQTNTKPMTYEEPSIDIDTGELTQVTKQDVRRVKDKEAIYQLFSNTKQPWMFHKQQREAALRLFDLKGLEQVQRAVAFMKQNSDDKFCPKAQTPFRLEEKWDALLAYRNRV